MIMIRIINCNSAIEFIFCGAFFSNGLCVAAIAPLPLFVDPADDERDSPETGIMDREVKNGRYILIPASDQATGHGTAGQARFWTQQLGELLQSALRDGR